MEASRPHESVPGNTTNTQILGAIEALLFVVVGGVVAARPPVLALVPVIVVIVGLLLLIRWMNAAPSRTREASSFLRSRYNLRGLLLNDLQEIVSYTKNERWTFHEFVWAVDFWRDDTLVPEFMADNWYEQQDREHSKATGKRARIPWRRRTSMMLRQWRRRLEGAMNSQPTLVEAAFRAGRDEMARIVVERAIAEGFVIECLEPYKHRAKITYSLNAERLRTQVTSE